MTHADGVASRSALARCTGDPAAFAREVWGRRASIHAAALTTGDLADGGRGFEDLLTLGDVDHLLSSTALRTPAFRLVKDGAALPASTYTRAGRIGSVPLTGLADPARIFRAFDEGATIVLQGMHRYWPPLSRFCRELELELGHPCQVNAYVTPPGSKGLALHTDSHDVFVLQAFGRKQWDVHASPAEAAAGGRQPLTTTLRPGDVLYMPKGTPHAAHTEETLSGHLTIGIHATTWSSLIDEAARALKRDGALGQVLPVGYHRDAGGLTAAVAERLPEIARRIDKLDPGEVAERLIDAFLMARPPLLAGGLTDVASLADLDDETIVRRRRGSVCELRPRNDRLAVLLGDRELRMPAWLEPAMRAVASRDPGEPLRPRDLAGELDGDSRLVLIRRLVREGLLEIEDPAAGRSHAHHGR